MTEIEQLRKDIEQAKEIMLRFYKQDRQALGIGEMHDRLAKLEAEAAAKADPWREHKEVLSGRFHTQQGADHDEKLVLNYAMHLQQTNEKLAFKARLDAARIAELETRLKNWGFAYGSVDPVKDLAEAKARIDELKAELARLREAHEAVGEAYDCKREDNKDLRWRIKELEAELAKRPVVYVLRRKKTGKVETWWSHGGGELPVLYLPCEVAWRREVMREELDDYAFETYTEDQS